MRLICSRETSRPSAVSSRRWAASSSGSAAPRPLGRRVRLIRRVRLVRRVCVAAHRRAHRAIDELGRTRTLPRRRLTSLVTGVSPRTRYEARPVVSLARRRAPRAARRAPSTGPVEAGRGDADLDQRVGVGRGDTRAARGPRRSAARPLVGRRPTALARSTSRRSRRRGDLAPARASGRPASAEARKRSNGWAMPDQAALLVDRGDRSPWPTGRAARLAPGTAR